MFKKIGIGVLVAIVLVVGVAGAVLAQGPTPPPKDVPPAGECPPCPCQGLPGSPGLRGVVLERLAEAMGVTVEELQEALAEGQTVVELAEAEGVALEDVVEDLSAPMVERIQAAVENGRITQEQADWIVERMQEALLRRLEAGPEGFRGQPGGPQLEQVAEMLDMDVEELREALVGGQTVAELAEAKGVAMDDIVAALVAPAAERIQAAVEDGQLTQEQADERIEALEERLIRQLESGPVFKRGGGFFPGRPGGRFFNRWGDNTLFRRFLRWVAPWGSD